MLRRLRAVKAPFEAVLVLGSVRGVLGRQLSSRVLESVDFFLFYRERVGLECYEVLRAQRWGICWNMARENESYLKKKYNTH